MIPVGILGAAGMVGQRYAQLLAHHPWFQVTFLAGSPRTCGQVYEKATEGRAPSALADLKIDSVNAVEEALRRCQLVFSCIGDREVARTMEETYASAGLAVVSNTSAHRRTAAVPVIIPEINAHHLDALPFQPWKGPLIAKPNCSLQSYLLPLYALHRTHRLKRAIITTLQSISGAGFSGVASMDILDNLIPLIRGEEEKSEWEPLKILGKVTPQGIEAEESLRLSAHCNRVPVIEGHVACVSVEFDRKPSREEILYAWHNFRGLSLPSAPEMPIVYRPEADRPQPRLDRDAGKGMAISVGRLRECPVLDWRFVGLSHNTIRGAAGGGILNAELLITSEYWHGAKPPSL